MCKPYVHIINGNAVHGVYPLLFNTKTLKLFYHMKYFGQEMFMIYGAHTYPY